MDVQEKKQPLDSSSEDQAKTQPQQSSTAAADSKKALLLTSPRKQKSAVLKHPQQQQLIRIQPQPSEQPAVQHGVVHVSPLTHVTSGQPQTIMVISPQRFRPEPAASVLQTGKLLNVSELKPAKQEHGSATSATLAHHDYALPKSQTNEKTAQIVVQSAATNVRMLRPPGPIPLSQTTVVQQQQQHPGGVLQLNRSPPPTVTSPQSAHLLKPLTATLQGGHLVINPEPPSRSSQSVTLRLQMKDISSLQKNISKLQQQPSVTTQPGIATPQSTAVSPRQPATVVSSPQQYIIASVNHTPQPAVVGGQQIKFVQSVQQPQQHVLKQLPDGRVALTLLRSPGPSSGSKAITVANSKQVVCATVSSAQTVLSSKLVNSSLGGKTIVVSTIPTTATQISSMATVPQTITISAGQQVTQAASPKQSVLSQLSPAVTAKAVRTTKPGRSLAKSPSHIQIVCTNSSKQSTIAAVPTSLQTVLAAPTSTQMITTFTAQQASASVSRTSVAPAATATQSSCSSKKSVSVKGVKLSTIKSKGSASEALQKAAASIAGSSKPSITVTSAKPIVAKKPSNVGPAASVSSLKATLSTEVTTVTQAAAKTVLSPSPNAIRIPGQAVGHQPGQILIMVNPGSGTLEEVKQIAAEASRLKGQPRSAENLQKLQYLQTRVRQLQSSAQSMKAKCNPSSSESATTVKKEGKKHKLQEKANRIVAEAVAKAKASGLQNIPKIMADVSLPEVSLETKKSKERKARPKDSRPRKPPKEQKEKKLPAPKAPKKKLKHKKVPQKKFPASSLVRLKNKRKHLNNSSSSGSEAEDALLAKALPEDDALGEKRRSSRNTKRKRYDVEYDFSISDNDSSDSDRKETNSNPDLEIDVVTVTPTALPVQNESAKFFVDNPDESEANVVEKILSSRLTKKHQLPGEAQVGELEELYVKYRNFSYLHCEWATIDKLQKGDQRIHQKIKRFRAKQRMQPQFFTEIEDELFNPDFILVDRILDMAVTEDDETKEIDTHYLVKWRSLPYEESTWELQQDVDDTSIQLYKKMMEVPPSSEHDRIEKAEPDDWTKLDKSPTYKGNNTLREYQLEGVNWLMFSWCNTQNCILADEMGLGKTIQALAFLREVQKFGIRGPFLVIAPLSTIANWQREFETWTDINAVVYHGSAQSRHMIAEYEMYFKDSKGRRIQNIHRFQVLITTYEIVLADCQELSEIDWRVVIIDEAHRLKNRNCKLLEGLRFLDIEHRVLLTGTPLQNNIDELFSLLNFLEPERFRSVNQFLGDFGDLKTEGQVEKLQQLLKPMMLRRLKEDVEKTLAEKEETIIEVELTNIQKKYYRAILERNFSFLSKGANTATNLPNLMNTMMELRKCCNHPFLINGAEHQIMLEIAQQPMDLGITQHLKALIQSAGKMVLLDKLLPRLKEGGHKVLIFSQMIRCLDILEDYLVQKRYPFERIDGRVRGNMRQAAIDRFSKPDSDRFVFLLCTRAGGLGINLTAADTCVIFDSDWNPQNDLQAQARCHRIGQTKSVKIYRLVTRNSYEREMFDKASMKLGLDKAVLQSMRGDSQSTPSQQHQPLSKKEIEDLLRKGAYGAIMDDDDAASKFCEEDIEMILQRRTRVMKIEGGQKGSTFAKASFSLPDGQRSDIKLDDPDFWDKWAKKAELDIEALKKKDSHVINEPRKRRQTRRFGNMDEMVEFTSNDDDSDDNQPTPTTGAAGKKGADQQKGGHHHHHHKGSSALGAGSVAATPSPPGLAKPLKPCKSQLQSGWTRLECFRVEKGLLTYGWGRWEDVLMTTRFKRPLGEKDVEAISRTMLIFCLKFYKGDENIKSFIWDLVTPAPDGSVRDYRNHKGLSAPVPRGRCSKKPKKEEDVVPAILEYDFNAKDQDPESLLTDQGYKNHLKRHCNKVLLRVRLLYYLKQEVIGDMADKIASGVLASELPLPMVSPEGEPPISWWDENADRSLLVGVFKHGYERYVAMRTDSTLCFLARCGAPNKREIARENADNDSQLDVESLDTELKAEGVDMDVKPIPHRNLKEDDLYLEDGSMSPTSTRTSSPTVARKIEQEPTTMPVIPGKLPFPLAPDVNTRLRRLVASYQRNHKRQQQKQAKRARREMVKQVRFEEQLRQRQLKKQENAQKWSRREEADFYRVLATFGVEQDPVTGQYDWSNFRKLAKLEKKYDHRLLEYYQHFRCMCLRKCKREEEVPEEFACMSQPDFTIEEISEERANKVLHRIDLLLKIRNVVLPHPEMEIRMRHCRKSLELPDWWEVGIHDRDLVVGIARYGINRLESQQQMLADTDLSFKDLKDKYPAMVPVPTPLASMKDSADPAVPHQARDRHGEDGMDSVNQIPEDDELRTSDVKPAEGGSPRETMRDDSKEPDESEDDESGIEDSGNEDTSQETRIAPTDGHTNCSSYSGSREWTSRRAAATPRRAGSREAAVVGLSGSEQEAALQTESGAARAVAAGDGQGTGDSQGTGEAVTNLTYAFLMKWPKDRVIVHRLENICHCVLKNCWPGRRQNHQHPTPSSSSKQQPLLEVDPDGGGGPGLDLPWDAAAGGIVLSPEHNYAGMADGLLALVQQRKRKRKRKSDPGVVDKETNETSTERTSPPCPLDLSMTSPRLQEGDDIPDEAEEEEPKRSRTLVPGGGVGGSRHPISEDVLRRRKKKSLLKIKMKALYCNAASTSANAEGEALQSRVQRRKKPRRLSLSQLRDDDRIAVFNPKTGVRLSGEKAPLKRDLSAWMEDNPDFHMQVPSHGWLAGMAHGQPSNSLTASEDSQEEPTTTAPSAAIALKPKRRRFRHPSKLDPAKLTGEERVGIVEKDSGLKLSPKLLPTLRNLPEWLEKHPRYHVAPEWGDLIRAKGNLPPELLGRILPPKSASPALIKPAVHPATLPMSPSSYSPTQNHLACSTDLSKKVSMQIGSGSLGGLALSGAYSLPTLPLGVAPIASLAGLTPNTAAAGGARPRHLKQKKHHKGGAPLPRKIFSAADQVLTPVGTAPPLAGISPFLLPSTGGMYYSPFLATQGLVPAAISGEGASLNMVGARKDFLLAASRQSRRSEEMTYGERDNLVADEQDNFDDDNEDDDDDDDDDDDLE